MSNVINFHPVKSKLFNFYEVVDKSGESIWAGEGEGEAITWLRRHIDEGARVLVSAWDAPDMDAHLVGEPIDITNIIINAFKEGIKL